LKVELQNKGERFFSKRVTPMQVSLSCPKCKAQNNVILKQINREETIQCVKCGTKIHLLDKDRSVKKATEKIE